MAVWFYEVDLSDEYKSSSALSGVPFEQWRDATVAKLESSKWFEDSEYLSYLTPRLKAAESPEEFGTEFELVYDAADEERCWIYT